MSIEQNRLAFAQKVGVTDIQWEPRGEEQLVSQIFKDEATAAKFANIIGTSLDSPGVVRTIKSRSGDGYRVVADHAPVMDIFIKNFLKEAGKK